MNGEGVSFATSLRRKDGLSTKTKRAPVKGRAPRRRIAAILPQVLRSVKAWGTFPEGIAGQLRRRVAGSPRHRPYRAQANKRHPQASEGQDEGAQTRLPTPNDSCRVSTATPAPAYSILTPSFTQGGVYPATGPRQH